MKASEEIESIEKEIELLKDTETIIVEGKNDKKALESFGVRNIITLAQPMYKVIEACNSEAAIVTDLDPEGRKLYRTLKDSLSKTGVKINDRFRKFLYRNTRLRQIEGLETYINNLRRKANGERQ